MKLVIMLKQTQPTLSFQSSDLWVWGFKEVSELKNCPYQLLEKGNNVLFQTAVGDLSAVEISASILSTLKSRAEEALGGDLSGCRYHCPSLF